MHSLPRKSALALIPAVIAGLVCASCTSHEPANGTTQPRAANPAPQAQSDSSDLHPAAAVSPMPAAVPQGERVVPLTAEAAKDAEIKNEEVQRRRLSVTLRATGHINPDVGKEVDVAARFTGRVTQVYTVPGQNVTKGAMMAMLASQDISDLEAEMLEAKSKLTIAEAQEERERQVYEEQIQRPKALLTARSEYQETKVVMELAESEYERLEGLYREKITSAKDYLTAKANLAKAKTAYNQASIDLQREERLFKNQALMKRDYHLAQAETSRAKQHLNTLQQRLLILGLTPSMVHDVLSNGKIAGAANVVAPVTGVISHQDIAPGEVVQVGKNMFIITDLSTVLAVGDIAEADLQKVKIGRPVTVTTSSYPNEKFAGTISYVSERVDPDTRTIHVRARLSNPLRHLKSNMYAVIDIASEPVEVLACPKSAVQERDGHKVVYVKTPAGYEERRLEVSGQTEDYFSVASGVKEGERVATQGSLLLKTELTYQH